MDLTAYVEKHEFCFDAVLDEHVTNDEVTSGLLSLSYVVFVMEVSNITISEVHFL